MPPQPISNEEGLLIHQRHLAGDPTAQSDLAVAYLDLLIDSLTERNRSVDPHLCVAAADEAIVSLIKNPGKYNPEGLPLDRYLQMAAQRDLLNLLRKESRHRDGRKSLESVELSDDGGKYLGVDDDPSLRMRTEEAIEEAHRSIPDSVYESLSDREKRVFELMCQGEKKTSVFAEAYDIGNLSPDDQADQIKQVKDRINKRLERARDRP